MSPLPRLSRLCRAVFFAMACGAMPVVAQAQIADQQTADQQTAIVDVIQSQLNALHQNDGPGAYRFAAPNIKAIFPSVDIFMAMVRGGYGFLIDPTGVEFLDIRAEGGALYQAVRIIGRDGVRRIAIYHMEQQQDGSWKIAGVYITEDPAAAV